MKKKKEARATNQHAAEVLAKITEYQSRQVPLLDEMTAAEQIVCYDQALAWLSQAKPRTTKYLTHRAYTQRSRELDVEMTDDLWWFRFFEANLTRLKQAQQQDSQETQE